MIENFDPISVEWTKQKWSKTSIQSVCRMNKTTMIENFDPISVQNEQNNNDRKLRSNQCRMNKTTMIENFDPISVQNEQNNNDRKLRSNQCAEWTKQQWSNFRSNQCRMNNFDWKLALYLRHYDTLTNARQCFISGDGIASMQTVFLNNCSFFWSAWNNDREHNTPVYREVFNGPTDHERCRLIQNVNERWLTWNKFKFWQMLVDSKKTEPRNLIRLLMHTFVRTIGRIIVILHTTYIVATRLVRGKNPHR
jgi:hypothetical protein